MPENKLEKTLAGFEVTKQLFAKSTPGKYFAFIRTIILIGYFLPLITSGALVLLKPDCIVTPTPLSVSGCSIMQLDMDRAIEFYLNTRFIGFIGIILLILVIKALFMIKFINVKIAPENK